MPSLLTPRRLLAGALTSLVLVAPAPAAAANISHASGTVTVLGGSFLTLQTSGRRLGVVNAMIAAADAVTRADYPYIWAGGHPEAGVASTTAGATRASRGHPVGFDCSGAVTAVLSAAGLWAAGSPVPADEGVISQLLSEGVIAGGAGRGPVDVTLYDDPGYHIFMSIDGRFFGTSDGGGGGDARGGAGWLSDGAPDAFNRAYRQYHVLPSVLRDSTSYGHSVTFQSGSGSAAALVGDRVNVTYRQGSSGFMVLTGLSWVGERTLSGTVSAVSSDGSTFTVIGAGGRPLSFPIPPGGQAPNVGDEVQVSWTDSRHGAVTRALNVTGQAPTEQASGTLSAVAGGGGSFTLQTASGTQTFTVSDPSGLQGASPGDQLSVSYIQIGGQLLAQEVSDAGPAAPVTESAG
jgi:hypothetical protein